MSWMADPLKGDESPFILLLVHEMDQEEVLHSFRELVTFMDDPYRELVVRDAGGDRVPLKAPFFDDKVQIIIESPIQFWVDVMELPFIDVQSGQPLMLMLLLFT